jgi:hypothetical protein
MKGKVKTVTDSCTLRPYQMEILKAMREGVKPKRIYPDICHDFKIGNAFIHSVYRVQ